MIDTSLNEAENVLISVVVPVYNCEEFIEECLNSIIQQNRNEIEIIAINDGSTDRSLEILRELESNTSNLSVVEQSNQGQSVARNKGVSLARGDYIFFLDSDDIVESNFLNQIIKYLLENPQFDLINLKYQTFTHGTDPSTQNAASGYGWELDGRTYLGPHLLESYFRGRISPAPYTYVVKRDLFTDNGITFLSGIHFQDAHLYALLLKHSRLTTFLELTSVHYRIREGSVTRSFSKKHLDSVFIFLEDLYSSCNIRNSRLRKYFVEFYFWQIYRNLANRIESIDQSSFEYLNERLQRSLKVIAFTENSESLTQRGAHFHELLLELLAQLRTSLQSTHTAKADSASISAEHALKNYARGHSRIYYLRVRYLYPAIALLSSSLLSK